MRAEITEKGVFNGEGKEMEVGETVEFKGETLPAALVGKAQLIGNKPKGEKMVVNPAKTKKRIGLEAQAAKLDVEINDDMTDDEIAAAIKAKKEG